MEKKYEILNYLSSKNEPITSKALCDLFGVSRRSVINYIKQLNEEVPEMISSTTSGYKLMKSDLATEVINKALQAFSFDSYEKRKNFILEKLLLNSKKITLQGIADQLCISELTLNKDLVRLRSELKESELHITTKNGRLFIIGEEKNKHKFLMKLLNQELEESKFNLSSIQQFFEIANIQKIKSIITKVLVNEKYRLDDISIMNYVLHLSICIETSAYMETGLSGSKLSQQTNFPFMPHFQEIIQSVYTFLKKEYPYLNFTLEQIADATVLMSTRALPYGIENFSLDKIDTFVGNDVKDLLIQIIQSVYHNYGIDLKNDEFMIRFAFHIKNLLIRLRSDIHIYMNSFISIKNDYPFLYIIACYIASLITNRNSIMVPENEISYIALHLGMLIETQKEKTNRVTCAVIAYDYCNIGKHLFDKISISVNNLSLQEVVSSFENLTTKNLDLIITTLDFDSSIKVPQIHVNTIPTDEDIQKIAESVFTIQSELQKKKLAKKLNRFFDENIFFTDLSIQSCDEAISYLCDNLYQNNYVDHNFKKDIYDHEKIVPTEYENVALPHSLLDNDEHIKKSAIAVWINKKPVLWVKNEVNFIFMIALKQEDKPLFSEIFNSIVTSLSNETTANTLMSCRKFSEFINIILHDYARKNI